MNHRPWINFKELRSRLRFTDVLALYRVEVRERGGQHQGPCPMPGHSASRNGFTFSANLEKGIFQCFSCHAKGNVLDFAALMEGVDPTDGQALRKVAVKLQERFCPDGASTCTRRNEKSPKQERDAAAQAARVVVNAPIDFELKGLDMSHEFFARQRLHPATVERFGLGFCSRGYLAGRIAIPLHDAAGKLIGYAGRAIDEAAVSDENPLYLYPERRERNGAVLDFDRSVVIYGLHRLETPCREAIITDDFVASWRLVQAGARNVVSLLSDDCLEAQVKLFAERLEPRSRVWLAMNDDGLAVRFVEALAAESEVAFVVWVRFGIQRPLAEQSDGEIARMFVA